MKKLFFLLTLLSIIATGCQSDDLCSESTATTPSLIIRFYDVDLQEDTKNVFDLSIQGEGNSELLDSYITTTTDSIAIPLKTNDTSTRFSLHSDSTVDDMGTTDTSDDIVTAGNEDIITVNYTTEQVYVSRGCGYKTIYKNVTVSFDTDAENWIELAQPVNATNQSVEDETAAHFKIFH